MQMKLSVIKLISEDLDVLEGGFCYFQAESGKLFLLASTSNTKLS